MDPLSIVSLTGNIAQFISIGYGILNTAREIYNSQEDSVHGLKAIRLLAEDVKRSVGMISKGIPSIARSGEDRALQEISKECDQLAVAILAQVEKLQIDGKKLPRGLRALRVSTRFWFKKKEIDEMLATVIALETRLRAWWFPTGIYQHSLNGENDAAMAIKADLDQVKSAANRLDIGQSILPGLEAKLDWIMTAIKPPEEGRDISARRAALDDIALQSFSYREETSRMKRHYRILRDFIFDSIYNREDKIEFAHIKTLEWLFDSPITNFRAWLEKGDGVYWISGLAGSGKSTAMKFVSSHSATRQALEKWAGDQEMVIASHYFWIAGTEMQKSLEGLLQTLLFHVLRNSPKLIDELFPEQVRPQRTHSLSELKALVSKLKGEQLGCCFCFFIDGLDEYHGAEEDIVQVVKDLAACPRIKICASSRPWSAFLAEWNSSPNSFRMQDFTRDDISAYVHDKVSTDVKFQAKSIIDPQWLSLPQMIVDRAEGIWIWVYFVVRELLRDIRDNEPFEHLQKRIDSYPIELSAFFDVIMGRIDRLHIKSAARLMLASTVAIQPLSILALEVLEEEEDSAIRSEIYKLSEHELMDLFNDWQPRLQNRCRDLMKLDKTTQGQTGHFRVEFLHRTVRDFLLEEHRDELQAEAGANFDARLSLCQVKLLELKRAEQDYDGSLHSTHAMALLHYAHLIDQEPMNDQGPQALVELLHELDRVMTYHSRLYRVYRGWNKLALDNAKKWPDLSWIAASAGLTHFTRQVIEANKNTAHVSVLLQCSLGCADLGVESTEGDSSIPVFARNINTVRLLLTTGADPNYSNNGSISPWVSFLRHLSPNWAKFNAQSKQIALDLICELVQRGAHIRIQDEEGHISESSIFEFVRNTLGEPVTAWRIQEIVKRRRDGERAKRESDSRLTQSFKPPNLREPQGLFTKLLAWTK